MTSRHPSSAIPDLLTDPCVWSSPASVGHFSVLGRLGDLKAQHREVDRYKVPDYLGMVFEPRGAAKKLPQQALQAPHSSFDSSGLFHGANWERHCSGSTVLVRKLGIKRDESEKRSCQQFNQGQKDAYKRITIWVNCSYRE